MKGKKKCNDMWEKVDSHILSRFVVSCKCCKSCFIWEQQESIPGIRVVEGL